MIYLRVSSSGQVKTDYNAEGISIPAQREACLRKARDLGVTVIDEYVEPGRSALEMTKREAFQSMLARVRSQGDVDVIIIIIIYQLSRMARNRYDDAIVMADLRERGVTLVSATEAVDDTPVGQLMHGILATFNEYQSRQSGADIAPSSSWKPPKSSTDAATTSNGDYSTKRSSTASASKTTRSPIMTSTTPSGSFTPFSANTSLGPQTRRPLGRCMEAAKRPPAQRMALQLSVSPCYSRASTQVRVLITTLGWRQSRSNPSPRHCHSARPETVVVMAAARRRGRDQPVLTSPTDGWTTRGGRRRAGPSAT